MANLPQLTSQQLAKLTQRPNWLSANNAISGPIAGRVFASNEGWMLSPTKVHPEGKQMPAECVMAIPNLSEYLEYNQGTPVVESAQVQAGTQRDLIFTSVSVTRRSRSRYIVNFAMDEALISMGVPDGVTFNFTATANVDPSTAILTYNQYAVGSGESFGRIQMDIVSDVPLNELRLTGINATFAVVSNFSSGVADKNTPPVIWNGVGLIDSDLGAKVDINSSILTTALNNIPSNDRWDGTTLTVVP